MLLFSTLDTLERLGNRDIQSYCTLRIAEATLQRLENEIRLRRPGFSCHQPSAPSQHFQS